jgi:lipid-binding SYLF domain-containing protein
MNPIHLIATRALSGILLAAFLLHVGPPAAAQSAGPQEPQLTPEEIEAARGARLKLAATGLEKLYKLHPEAQQTVEKAAGYAVFDVTSIYVLLFVGQKGAGVLFDNKTRKPTYMQSMRAGTGPGVGKQRVYQVFIFKSNGSMEQFVLAGGTGGDVSASMSTGKGGSMLSFNPDIDIYQIPESGIAVQASWGGTVYSVDAQLK